MNTAAEQFTARTKGSTSRMVTSGLGCVSALGPKSSETRWAPPAPTAMTEGPARPLTNQKTVTLRGHTRGTEEQPPKPSPVTSPQMPTCKRQMRPQDKGLLWGAAPHSLSLHLPPLLPHRQASPRLPGNGWASGSLSQALPEPAPKARLPRPPSGLRQPRPGPPVAPSAALSPSSCHCPQR